jgi:hypothetical protein
MNLKPDCNPVGAWLIVSLQDDETPDLETVLVDLVIAFWCHYANVVDQ